jgi:hypothetical protein
MIFGMIMFDNLANFDAKKYRIKFGRFIELPLRILGIFL